METKNDPGAIPDDEFLILLHKAKDNDEESILKLIEMFKSDILRTSKYIYMPQEDAVSNIIVELLEMIKDKNQ